MATRVFYIKEFDNTLSEDNVWKTVGARLGFKTARRGADFIIGFKKGASHTNWLTKQRVVAWKIAAWNINGTYRARPRPFFKEYVRLNKGFINKTLKHYIEDMRGGTIVSRAYAGTVAIKDDLAKWVYDGGMLMYPNTARYERRKIKAGCSSMPLVAKGQLLSSMEVRIEQ